MRRTTAIAFAAGILAGVWCAGAIQTFRPAKADVVEKVNRQVNALSLSETVDQGGGPEPGGCRLYAREKMRRLIAAGIAPARLRLWVVITKDGLHEVLVVDGDRVLDNLVPVWTEPRRVMEREGYVFLEAAKPS